jgi:hypothetical protein
VPIEVDMGYFTVLLGDTTLSGMSQPLGSSVFAGAGRYLRVWVAASSSGPFVALSLAPIAAAPYALVAETLDGYDSGNFASTAAYAGGDQSLNMAVGVETIVRSVTISVPSSGVVIVDAVGYAQFESTGRDLIRCSITTGSEIDFDYATLTEDFGATTDWAYSPFALTRGYSVSSGTHTFNLVCELWSGEAYIEDTNITAEFTPGTFSGSSSAVESQSTGDDSSGCTRPDDAPCGQ